MPSAILGEFVLGGSVFFFVQSLNSSVGLGGFFCGLAKNDVKSWNVLLKQLLLSYSMFNEVVKLLTVISADH